MYQHVIKMSGIARLRILAVAASAKGNTVIATRTVR